MASIGIAVDDVAEDVSVRPAQLAEAAALAVPAGATMLVVDRVHRCDGRAVEVAEIVVPADKFRLRYRFPAGPARTGR
jgi:DNA-binding GntR family transcriptional regulator